MEENKMKEDMRPSYQQIILADQLEEDYLGVQHIRVLPDPKSKEEQQS